MVKRTTLVTTISFFVILVALFLFNSTIVGAITPVTDCMDLVTTNGEYKLSSDLEGNRTSGYCLLIKAQGITIDCDGHSIKGNESGTTYGIYASGSSAYISGARITNCSISNYTNGIYIFGTTLNFDDIIINNSKVYNNSLFSVYIENVTNSRIENNTIYQDTYGIVSGSSRNITIQNNSVRDSGVAGIGILNNKDDFIFNNTIQGSFYTGQFLIDNSYAGINLIGGSNNTVKSNKIYNNTRGILVGYDHISTPSGFISDVNDTIIDNDIYNNLQWGIDLGDNSTNNYIKNNTIRNSTYGISINETYIQYRHNNTLINNNISNTTVGIYLNRTHNNSIINNTIWNSSSFGVNALASNYTIIENNTIFNSSLYGMYIENATYTNITNNTIRNNTFHGFEVIRLNITKIDENKIYYNGRNGIDIWNSTNISITNNIMHNNYEGIFISNVNYTEIAKNLIYENKWIGIFNFYSQHLEIKENEIYDNKDYGISISFSSSDYVNDNNVYGNKGGFLFYTITNMIIEKNYINDNQFRGVSLDSSIGTIVFNNTIQGSGEYGLSMTSGISNNITNNTFYNNTYGIVSSYGHLQNFPTTSGDKNDIIINNVIHGNLKTGIDLGDKAQNFYIFNNTIYSNENGIVLNETGNSLNKNNHTITKNIINYNNKDGILILYSHYNNITNDTITDNNENGIEIQYSNYTNITNNILYNNTNSISAIAANRTNVTNNIVYSNRQSGISGDSVLDLNITNNTAHDNADFGIIVTSNIIPSFTVIEKNIVYKNNFSGIGVGTFNSIIRNNNVSGTKFSQGSLGYDSLGGITVLVGRNNTVENNVVYDNVRGIISGTGRFGVLLLVGDAEDKILNNTVYDNLESGIDLGDNSVNFDVRNNIVYRNVKGIVLNSTYNSTIQSNTFFNNTFTDVYSFNSTNNTFINTTIGHESIAVNTSFDGFNYMIKQLEVIDRLVPPSNYSDVGVWIKLENITTDSWIYIGIVYNETIFSNSGIPLETNLKFWRNELFTGWSRIGDTVDSANNYVIANISSDANELTQFSQYSVLGSLIDIDIVSCVNITQPNKIYTISNNLTGSQPWGGCIGVNNNSVIIDCDEYNIKGSSPLDKYGIFTSGYNNTTIINCDISGYAISGIAFENSTNVNLTNNTIRDSYTGIRTNRTDNVSIKKNKINGTVDPGVYLDTTINSKIIDNSIDNSTTVGSIIAANCNYSEIKNNNLTRGQLVGIGLIGVGNTIDSNYISGVNAFGGIFSHSSKNNIVKNNIINNSVRGIVFGAYRLVGVNYGGNENETVSNNSIYNSIESGIDLGDNSIGLNIYDNKIYSGRFGIVLNASTYNITLSNNKITNSTEWYVYSFGISNCTFVNTTLADSGVDISAFWSGRDYKLKKISPIAVPSNRRDIQKFVNITNTSIMGQILFNVSYNENELINNSVIENTLKLWAYNGTWNEAQNQGLDMTKNYVYTNVPIISYPFVVAPLGTGGDLSVSGITFDPTNPTEDKLLDTRIEISNIGDANMNNVTAYLYVDGNLTHAFDTISSITKGTRKTILYSERVAQGNYNYSAYVNSTDPDMNMTNNYLSKILNVSVSQKVVGGGGGETTINKTKVILYKETNIDPDLAEKGSSGQIMAVNESVIFTYKYIQHRIKVLEITTYVNFSISSSTFYLSLKPGEKREIDVDGDGKNEISIEIIKIENNRAFITFRSLTTGEVVIEPEPEENITEPEPTGNETGEGLKISYSTIIGVSLISLIVAAAVILVYFVRKRPSGELISIAAVSDLYLDKSVAIKGTLNEIKKYPTGEIIYEIVSGEDKINAVGKEYSPVPGTEYMITGFVERTEEYYYIRIKEVRLPF